MNAAGCNDAGVPLKDSYDVVIVGGGISGALVAQMLGAAGRSVLILEAGDQVLPNSNAYLQRFYQAAAKLPEAPYTPELFDQPADSTAQLIDPAVVNAGRPTVKPLFLDDWKDSKQSYLIQTGKLPFASTYERIAGGTARHWLGISLRHVPNDFTMADTYNPDKSPDWPEGLVNWPRGTRYPDLKDWYIAAEKHIGVSGDNEHQKALDKTFHFDSNYAYPMPEIPSSTVDQHFADAFKAAGADLTFDGIPLSVTPTPAARNSQPFGDRRVCAGNTNCIPICPIQAKYDPTISLRDAMDTGKVTLMHRAVACDIQVGENGRIGGIKYKHYSADRGGSVCDGVVKGTLYVLAANSIETPRLLLMSRANAGIANSSGAVGRHLMDHPYYVSLALANKPVYPYRGPLETSGIEVMRDGAFRKTRGAFRADISNDGWSLSFDSTAEGLTLDFMLGTNHSGMNNAGPGGSAEKLFGTPLVDRLNYFMVRQVRLGFLVEQTPDKDNRVTLSKQFKDGLGLFRPEVAYDLSPYTKRGLAEAQNISTAIFKRIGAKELPQRTHDPRKSNSFEWPEKSGNWISFIGAGHIMGTCRMGDSASGSVVNARLRSWDHPNLFIIGSSVFPTVGTANPTLTIAALALRLANDLKAELANSAAGHAAAVKSA